mgnify:CR=1 FL=1
MAMSVPALSAVLTWRTRRVGLLLRGIEEKRAGTARGASGHMRCIRAAYLGRIPTGSSPISGQCYPRIGFVHLHPERARRYRHRCRFRHGRERVLSLNLGFATSDLPVSMNQEFVFVKRREDAAPKDAALLSSWRALVAFQCLRTSFSREPRRCRKS